MKWLSAVLAFFNATTILALVTGILAQGLNRTVATFSVAGGVLIALLAYRATANIPLRARKPKPPPPAPSETKSRRQQRREERMRSARTSETPRWRYRSLWFWLLAACFTIFAVRSFCWLVYYDGNEVKVQSPNNLGDLSLHLTYIRHFASGVPLWPDNPIEPFSKLRYPAGVDLFNAVLTCLGIDVTRGLVWTGVLASIATFYALYRWAGNFGIAAFLFNGGLASFFVFKGSGLASLILLKGVSFPFFQTLSFQDYQGANNIAWKSIALSMFVTQRGLLYAFPAALLLLYQWRARFFPTYDEPALVRSSESEPEAGVAPAPAPRLAPLPRWLEISLYATMPLYHSHTFIALSVVLAFLFILGDRSVGKATAGLVGLAVLPATCCVWITTDYFHAGSFIKWQPHWVQRSPGDMAMPFLQFWLINFGAWVPLILFFIGITLLAFWKMFSSPDFKLPAGRVFLVPVIPLLLLAYLVKIRIWESSSMAVRFGGWMLILFLPLAIAIAAWWAWKQFRAPSATMPASLVFVLAAVAIFLLGYLVKLAPWEWDNIKIIVWAYLIILPFLWMELLVHWPLYLRVPVYVALFASGFITLFGGLAAGKTGFGIADRYELDNVGMAVKKLPADARYAGFPTWGHPVLLQGRKMVLGYPGHLWTQGFDYSKTNDKLQALMLGSPNWKELARLLRARYLFWGREEKNNYAASKRPWEREAALVASGDWGAIYDLETPRNQPSPAPPPSVPRQ
jgi:hypothetical protein